MTMERLCRQFALQSRASSLTSLSSSAMRHLSESFRSPSSASHLIVLGAAYASLSEVARRSGRSEEHTSELQSLMRISYAVFCLKKKKKNTTYRDDNKKVMRKTNRVASVAHNSTHKYVQYIHIDKI